MSEAPRLDEVYGRLHSVIEDAILDLMLLLEKVDRAWAEASGVGGEALKRPDWNELLELRRQLKAAGRGGGGG